MRIELHITTFETHISVKYINNLLEGTRGCGIMHFCAGRRNV